MLENVPRWWDRKAGGSILPVSLSKVIVDLTVLPSFWDVRGFQSFRCCRRFRRRGSRSQEAVQRRALRFRMRSGEIDVEQAIVDPFPTEFNMHSLCILSSLSGSAMGDPQSLFRGSPLTLSPCFEAPR